MWIIWSVRWSCISDLHSEMSMRSSIMIMSLCIFEIRSICWYWSFEFLRKSSICSGNLCSICNHFMFYKFLHNNSMYNLCNMIFYSLYLISSYIRWFYMMMRLNKICFHYHFKRALIKMYVYSFHLLERVKNLSALKQSGS